MKHSLELYISLFMNWIGDGKLNFMNDQTLNYYDQNAKTFVLQTRDLDFSSIQNKFLQLLPVHGTILDLGCGSGRDAKAFLTAGFRVDAIDGSEEICKLASSYLGIAVRHQSFDQLDASSQYDGIWACSSLLHLPKEKLPEIFARIEKALKPGGIFYCSFKQGEFEGLRNGRYFSDLTFNTLETLVHQTTHLQPIELWTSEDIRTDRPSEYWTNALFSKPYGQ